MTVRCREQPCATCPYRRDVPSGLWSADEYRKLPDYDAPTGDQPLGAFHCHTSSDFICTGWAVCHERQGRGHELLALRFVASMTGEPVLVPDLSLPLFASGREAAEHGLHDIDHPGREARVASSKIRRMRSRRKLKRTRQP